MVSAEATHRTSDKTTPTPGDAASPIAHAQNEVNDLRRNGGNVQNGAVSESAQSMHKLLGTVTLVDDKSLPARSEASTAAQPAETHHIYDFFAGVGNMARATGSGIADAASGAYEGSKNALAGAGEAIADTYNHSGEIATRAEQAIAGAADATVRFGEQAVHDPLGTTATVARATGDAAMAVGHGAIKAGTVAVDATVGAAQWVGNHKLETAAIVGAAALEVATVGTATPVLAGLAVGGSALAMHSAFSTADKLAEHSNEMSVLFNSSSHTDAELAQARQTLAPDLASGALDLVSAAAGVGIARVAGRFAKVAAETEETKKAVDTTTKVVGKDTTPTHPVERSTAQTETQGHKNDATPEATDKTAPVAKISDAAKDSDKEANFQKIFTPAEHQQMGDMLKTQQSLPVTELSAEERAALIDKNYGDGAANQGRRLDIVIGPPGAGKSSLLVNPLSAEHGSLVIDPDPIKTQIPGWMNGLGADATHDESSKIASGLLARAIENGDNIVLPKLGKSEASLQGIIEAAKNNGYEVNLHLADLPAEKAARRTFDRAFNNSTGDFQWVYPRNAFDVGSKPRETFEALIHRPNTISEYSHYDTDVPRGVQPPLVRSSVPALEAKAA